MKLIDALLASPTAHARRPIYDAETMKQRSDIAKYVHKDDKGYSFRWPSGKLIAYSTDGSHSEHIEEKDDWEAL